MDEYGLRERKKLERRASIIAAGVRLFAERGYAATTVADIAAAADVAPRTVSLYFPAKQEIALAYLVDMAERLEASLRERPAGMLAVDAIVSWMRAELGETDRASREATRRMFAANPDLHALGTTRLDPAVQATREAIAADMGWRVDEPRAALVTAAAMGLIEHVWDVQEGADLEEGVALVRRFLLAGLDSLRTA